MRWLSLLALLPLTVNAQLAVEGTPAETTLQASAANWTFNLPADIQAGELLACTYTNSETADNLSATGWTDEHVEAGANQAIGVIYKVATGSEGATQVFDNSSGSAFAGGSCFRLSGYDSGDVLGVTLGGANASEDPFVLAANTLTGMTVGNWALLVFGTENANRTVTTPDGDTTLIDNVTGGVSGFSHHVYYEDLAGTGNSAYSFDMSDTRDWRWALFEINEASAGGSIAPLAHQYYQQGN